MDSSASGTSVNREAAVYIEEAPYLLLGVPPPSEAS